MMCDPIAEVEGGILGLLQLPEGKAAVAQLAKTAEEVFQGLIKCHLPMMGCLNG